MSVRGRVALVTGVNRGLGLETTRSAAREGTDGRDGRRDHALLERARRTLGLDEQSRAVAVPMDVTDPDSIVVAHRTVSERLGAVEVLVNNAAVLLFENDDVLSIPPDGYHDTFETNVFGVIDVCCTFVPEGDGTQTIWSYRQRLIACRAARHDAHVRARVFDVESCAERLHSHSRQHPPRRRRVGQRCRSTMGSHGYGRSVRTSIPPEGADTIVWLATLPNDGPTGGFFHDRRAIEW